MLQMAMKSRLSIECCSGLHDSTNGVLEIADRDLLNQCWCLFLSHPDVVARQRSAEILASDYIRFRNLGTSIEAGPRIVSVNTSDCGVASRLISTRRQFSGVC